MKSDSHMWVMELYIEFALSDIQKIHEPSASLGPYWQHFIFFVTYYCAQKARLLHYIVIERLAGDKRSSLSDPFISHKGNEVLWKWPLILSHAPPPFTPRLHTLC